MRIGLGNVLTTEEHLRNGWELIQKSVEGCALSRPSYLGRHGGRPSNKFAAEDSRLYNSNP
jgi:hypothetical protein